MTEAMFFRWLIDASTSSIADENFDSSCPVTASNLVGAEGSDMGLASHLQSRIGRCEDLETLTLTHPLHSLYPELDEAGKHKNHSSAQLIGE